MVIRLGRDVEVVGMGTVTLLDGRRMVSNAAKARAHERLELMGVRLLLLPADNRYSLRMDGHPSVIPNSLTEVVTLLSTSEPENLDGRLALGSHAV